MKSISTTILARLACVALFGLAPCQPLTCRANGAEDTADPYDVLYDVIMTRQGPDGKTYAKNESSPTVFELADFPFGDGAFKKFNAALDEFSALPQEQIEAYSEIRRALMQRLLWRVFDVTSSGRWERLASIYPNRIIKPQSYSERRLSAQPKIASLIQRLALTETEIRSLPNTMRKTIASGRFPQSHDPQEPFRPFLPADLTSIESSWICMSERGVGELTRPVPAHVHSQKLKWRSMFLQFIRVPGGRDETLKYMDKLNDRRENLPRGTQFALIEQAYLISDKGEMILSPLVVSISLRAYLNVDDGYRDVRPEATQCVAEFVMQPRQLMKGDAVMKALGISDHRFETGDSGRVRGELMDPFEAETWPSPTRLNLCMSCHDKAGLKSVKTLFPRALPVFEGNPDDIGRATSTAKHDDTTWKTLREFWQLKSEKESESVGADQPPDPYDVLYDVIMVRKDSDGKAYATNEVGPLVYRRSKFPFDDETFPKLMAAFEGFNALSQTQIMSYGAVKRALLQRHLWVVFDATIPNDYKPPTHMDRRRETQKMLANLIRRVALTKDEIMSLPDTLAATIRSGKFPQEHEPKERFKPFLPPDVYAKDGPWVCMGKAGNPTTHHARIDRWRSAFFQFVRLPGGRDVTLEYIKKLNDREGFPIGTQFALVDQTFLISDQGELVLSPIILSIQLRAYLNVKMTDLQARPEATACVAEFVMQPEQIKKGELAMRALGPKDLRLQTISADSGGRVDPLEATSATEAQNMGPSLQQCTFCHTRSRSGVRSLGAFMFGDRHADKLTFQPGSPAKIAETIAAAKREDETWNKLQELWSEASRPIHTPR